MKPKYRYYVYGDGAIYKVDSKLRWKVKPKGEEWQVPVDNPKNRWSKRDSDMCTEISEVEAFEITL